MNAAPLFQCLGTHHERLLTSAGAIGDADLRDRVGRLADRLHHAGDDRVASRLDNGPDWLVLDLALRRIGAAHIPLPTFFSPEQVLHALTSSGARCVVGAAGTAPPPGTSGRGRSLDGNALMRWNVPPAPRAALHPATACVTYTSGTTGRPRGVCLDAPTLLTVADALVQACAPIGPRRHLCLLPLSTLLENVAGLYAPLLSGAQIALPSLGEIGYTGASGLDPSTLVRCLARYRPESVILVPQLLQALVAAAESGMALPDSLRCIAVGGARVGAALLARARRLGLPVLEGYGLTECASVVCLNRPGLARDGSVGQPLAHARVEIADDELLIHGPRALGYVGDAPMPPGPVRTGDLGRIDNDGFVHIEGRRRNVFITAFGRNVSPEWVESELVAHPDLAQAVVWGEAQADNVAVLVARRPDADDASVRRAVVQVNEGLPDYARIARIVRARAPFSLADGLLTANGRPRREAVLARYQAEIDLSYRSPATMQTPGATR